MLKRIVLFVFVLSTLALLAMAPTHVNQSSENTHKLQTTVEVTVVVGTPGTDATPAPGVPVTGGGIPMSTLIIFGLLGLLGLVILIGGAALLNSRRQ